MQLVTSPRSPLPLLAAGIAVALLLILFVTLPQRPAVDDPSLRETLNEREAVTLVAREVRSGAAAARLSAEGRARFSDGSWTVTLGDAQFRFSERNRIVLAENAAARTLQFDENAR